MIAAVLAEVHEHAGLWEEYRELITDPAHLLLEATLIVAIDGLLLGLAVPFVRRWIRKHDREHHSG
jgi:hypothetical protein